MLPYTPEEEVLSGYSVAVSKSLHLSERWFLQP